MSYTLLAPDATPEDYAAYNRGLARAPLAATSLAPGALAQVLPAAQNEQGEVRPAIPGVATSIYGGLGTLIPAAINYVLGRELVPNLPGAETANQEYADTSRLAKNMIPAHKLAENEDEARIHEMLFSGGGMLSPIPGAALTRLPTAALRAAAHIALPTKEAMPVAVPGMALVSGALEHMGEQAQDEPVVKLFQSQQQQQQTPGQGGSAQRPFPTNSTQPIVLTPELMSGDQGTTAAPTYSGEGETDTDYLRWLARGAAVLGGAWVTMKLGGKILNPIIESLPGATKYTGAAEHNAALAARDAGNIKPGGPPIGEVKLPGGADSPMTRLSQRTVDSNRVINAFTEATAPTKTAAAELEATTGTTNSHAAQTKIIGSQMMTGVSEATGRVHPKLDQIVRSIDQLNEGEQKVLDIGLFSRDELDTRKDLTQKLINDIKRGKKGGTEIPAFDDTQVRHNFYNTHSDDLRHAVALMENNPKLAAIADQIKALNLSHIDEMEARGRITKAVAADVRRVRPHYISSVDVEGKITHPFGERGAARWEGFDDIPTRSWDTLVQHYDAVYKDMAKNDWIRNIVKNALDWQGADSTRPIIFKEKVSPKMTEKVDPVTGQVTPNPTVMEATPGPKERTITVHTPDGPKTYHVYNTTLWKALHGNNSQVGALVGGANTLRKLYQSGTTGVAGSIIAQRPFAVTGLLRNALQIPIDRTPGTIGGPIERVLGKGHYRGIDPFFVAGSIAEAGRGAGAVMAKNLSIAMSSADHPLRKILGDKWADAYATKLQARYLGSRAGQRHAQGLGGAGTQGTTDLTAWQLGESTRRTANPLSDVAPTLWRSNGFTRLPGGKGTTATFINLKALLRDLHQEVQDGANSYYYELNKAGIGKRRAAYESQRVLGDPGHMGSGPWAQGLGRSIPYFNPMVQDAVRLARNFRDAPFATTMGTVQTLGALAVAQTLTAMLGGPDHVNHMEEGLSNQQRAANARFYHDGTDALNNTQISLPQRWRVLYPIILEMVSTALGAFQAHGDEDIRQRLIHTISDFFSHHIQNSTHTSSLHGLSDMTDMVIPPQISAIPALLGSTESIQPHLGTLIQNIETGQPWNSGMLRPQTESRVPGQTSDSTIMSSNDGQWLQQVLGAVFGAAGKAIADTYGASKQRMMQEGGGFWSALTGFGSDAGQNFRDNAPWGNIVWGNTARLTTYNPMEESVSSALNAMRQTQSPTNSTSLGFASSGSSKPLAITGEPTKPTDPVMFQMQGIVKNYYNSMAPLLKEISDIKVQMKQSQSIGLSGSDKRAVGNDYAVQLNNSYAKVDARIKQMNEVLSRMVGKPVDVRTIDWSRDRGQF